MSRHGDRYFDGYERRTEIDENGRKRSKLVYVGQWYGYPEKAQQKRVKLVSTLLAAIVLVSYLYAQLHPSEGGMARFMALPSLLSLVPMMFQLIGLANLLLVKEKWELHVYYAGFRRLHRWGIATLVLLACWLGMELVYLVLHLDVLQGELVYLILAVLGTAVQAVLVAFLGRNRPIVVEGPKIR